MQVTVETGKWAMRYVSERIIHLEMPEGSTIADIVTAIKIPPEEAGLAVINGTSVTKEHTPSDGDVITIHPIIIGG